MTYEEADAMESPIYHGARFTVEVAGRLVAEHNYSLDRLLENAYDLVPSGAVASVWCVGTTDPALGSK